MDRSGWKTIWPLCLELEKNHTTSVSCLSRRGCTIPFEEKPLLSPVPIFFQHFSRPELEEEVLLQKRAVEKVNPESPEFNSRIFLVPKKERKVKTHNRSDQTEFLCQNPGIQNRNSGYSQTGNSAQRLVIFFLDLIDAYFYVPIHRHVAHINPGLILWSGYESVRLYPSLVAIATHLRQLSRTMFPYVDEAKSSSCSGRQIAGPPRRCGSSKAFWENQWFPARCARNQ